MTKPLTAVWLLLFAFILVGCGGGDDLASPTAPSRDGTAQTYTLSISVTGPTSLVVGSSSQFFATATLSGGSYGQPNLTEDVKDSATWTSGAVRRHLTPRVDPPTRQR